MKLEDQICALVYSRLLKILGVKQESLIYWEKCPENNNEFCLSYPDWHDKEAGEWGDCHLLKNQEHYSAFSAAELLNMLPQRIALPEGEPFNSFRFNLGKSVKVINDNPITIQRIYMANYFCDTICPDNPNPWFTSTLLPNNHDTNPANSLAKALIFILENNITTKDHINAL